MSAEIHRITAAGPITEPDQNIVAELETMLVEAQAGLIKGLGVFYVGADDMLTTTWVAGCARQNDMVAGATRLQARVVARSLE